MNDAAHAPSTSYIANAGLVLVHPFLPRLFKKLDLLTTGDNGRPQLLGEHGARAVQLLQYLADGRTNAPEPELVLNRLLCGLSPDFPAPPIDLSDEETAAGNQLLGAVIGNWPNMQKTSPEALRETFLQRDGRLQWIDGQCSLTIARKTVDVLVDQVAWGFAVIQHPWMRQTLNVTW
ncbi:contractile injection system tape measure protein [Janthinobacterium sp. MDB2-8]|uniref:contractile injection system tape measure protein n=1 Tax=Janthinobacterium sp. MDB2-8 TaxID=1259338 RepID=UPI003F263EC0